MSVFLTPHLFSFLFFPFLFINITPHLSSSRHRRFESLQEQVGAISCDALRLVTEVDDCSALLLEAVARCDELALDLADSNASIDIMKKEKSKISTESCRLRNESQAIYVLSLPHSVATSTSWNSCKNDYEKTISYLTQIQENEKENNGNYTQLADSSLKDNYTRGSVIEERVVLMQRMENLYQQAVQTQSSSKREQQTIKTKITAITIDCAKSKEEISELDEKIRLMQNRKNESEEALRQYASTNNVQNIQKKMMATVDFNETVLRDMEQDKKLLNLLMSAALESEKQLKAEIETMRRAILEYHRKKIKVRETSMIRSIFYHLLVVFLFSSPSSLSLSIPYPSSSSLSHTLFLLIITFPFFLLFKLCLRVISLFTSICIISIIVYWSHRSIKF